MTKLYIKNDNYYILSIDGYEDNTGLTHICNIETLTDFEAFEFNGQILRPCQASPNGHGGYSHAIVYTIDSLKPKDDVDEILYEPEIICPVCGYEFTDCWEYADDNENEECDSCGAIFSYQRNVEVTYSSELVEYPKFKKYNEAKDEKDA